MVIDHDWDLAEVIVGANQPKDTVDVYLATDLSYTLANLEEAQANETDEDVLAKIEKMIVETRDLIKGHKYTFHLTGVPDRMLEEISSKALSEFPIKTQNLLSDENAHQRNIRETILVWHAQIEGVTNPKGQTRRNWTEDEMTDFYHSIPQPGQKAVNEKLAEIREKSNRYVADSKNLDFSLGL